MQDNLNPDGSERTITAATGALHRVEANGSFARVLDGIGLSNTLAWVDGGRTMYFGDSGANRIRRYHLDEHGDIIAAEEFHAAPPAGFCDGSAIDAEGYLWNARFAAGRLVRFAPGGRVDCEVELLVSNPTSCCFGGSDLRTLFVTSARFALTAKREPARGFPRCAAHCGDRDAQHAICRLTLSHRPTSGVLAGEWSDHSN
jgi:sugar lactone lactonase YvrE